MNDDYAIQETYEVPVGEGGAEPPVESTWGLSEQVDQVVRGLSGLEGAGQVYLADVRQLEPYPGQPFRPYPPQRLRELADDIARVGILSPILVRRQERGLQILAGHNRWQAAKLAGLAKVPVLVLDVDDDTAVLVLTSTNLRQRESLLPSEKAFAYKMQMEALRRQGQRSEDGESYDASSFITGQTGDSRTQVNRYIRLTGLDPGLLKLLDEGKIGMTPAVAVSAIRPAWQREVLKYLLETGGRLSLDRAQDLKIASEDPMGLTPGDVRAILEEPLRERRPREYYKFPAKKIRRLLPEGMPEELVEGYILDALKLMACQVEHG